MKMHVPSSAVSCKLCKTECADNGALNKHIAEAHPIVLQLSCLSSSEQLPNVRSFVNLNFNQLNCIVLM